MDEMCSRNGMAVSIDGDWLTVRPSMPATSRRARTPRKLLAAYLHEHAESGHVSLEREGEWLQDLPPYEDASLWQPLAALVGSDETMDAADSGMVRFYGSFSSDEQQELRERGIPFRSMSAAQIAGAERLVFGSERSINLEKAANPAELQQFKDGVFHEPTQGLPTGFPADGFLKLNENDRTMALTLPTKTREGQTVPMRPLEARMLAWSLFRESHRSIFPGAGHESGIDSNRLRSATVRALTFTFQFSPVLDLSETLGDDIPDAGPPRPLSQLPEEFRKAYEKEYAAFEARYRDYKPPVFPPPAVGGNPPP
jgi:hypothetical protein